MESLSKCLLLPIDGTEESLRPISFVQSLYPGLEQVNMILCYFISPLPPIYQHKPDTAAMLKRKMELLRARDLGTRSILEHARQSLIRTGFPSESIQEHVQEKELTVAHHACLLADTRKVDAVLVQKRVSSGLEGFLRGDTTDALISHCLMSPVWLTDGNIDSSRAVICIRGESACLRAADHASFMLSDTSTHVTLLHVTGSISEPISSPAYDLNDEVEQWFETKEGSELMPFLITSCEMFRKSDIDAERVQVVILPGRGNAASHILSYCRQESIGIMVVGHSNPTGIWGFLKSSITRNLLNDLKDMALWVVQ
jgi:nucleotide-binding universal stress UspA family protein